MFVEVLVPVVIIQGDHTGTAGQLYHAHNTLLVGQYGARIVTYFSVLKVWFTLRASARAVAPEPPILFPPRLWKRVLQN